MQQQQQQSAASDAQLQVHSYTAQKYALEFKLVTHLQRVRASLAQVCRPLFNPSAAG
jgi:hypothetical protein